MEISAIKFKAALIHFLSDIFVAIAIAVAFNKLLNVNQKEKAQVFLKILLQVKHKEEKKNTQNKSEEKKLDGVNK